MGLILPWADALGHFPVTSEGISWVFLNKNATPTLDISSAHPSLFFFFFSLCLYSLCTYLCAFLFAKRPFTIILLFSQFLYNIYLSMKGFLLNVGGRNFILNAFSRGSCFEKLGWILDIQENRMPLPLCMKMHTCVLVNGQNLGASGVRGKVQGTSWWGKRRSNLIV